MQKKWVAIIVVLLIVALLAFTIWKNSGESTLEVDVVQLEQATIAETIMTPGTLTLMDEQKVLYNAQNGEIAEVFVKKGDKVKVGDPLFRYASNTLEFEEKQNELHRRSVYLQLDRLNKKQEKIRKALAEDRENELLKEENDAILLERQLLNIDIERSQVEKEAIEERKKNLTVYADVAGTVIEVNDEQNTSVQFGETPLIHIVSLDKFIVTATVSQYDALKIKEGLSVRLTSDAIPEQEWEGKVEEVALLPEVASPLAMNDGSTGTNYPIRISINGKIDAKPGFKMLTEIKTEEKQVETIPATAIQQRDNQTFVYIVENNKAKRVNVTVGSVDADKIEIKSGLSKEDKVIVSPPDDLKSGMEVKLK